MQAAWESLHPTVKRGLTLAGIAGVFAVLVALFAPGYNDDNDRRAPEPIRHILTDANTRAVGVDSLAAQVKMLNAKNTTLQQQIDTLRRDVDQARRQNGVAGVPPAWEDALQQLRTELEASSAGTTVTEESFVLEMLVQEAGEGTKPMALSLTSLSEEVDTVSIPATTYFATAPLPVVTPPYPDGKPSASVSPPTAIRMIEPEPEPIAESDVMVSEPPPLYLPTGSILSGALITGLDAPTHDAAQREPFPVLIRLDQAAILPNRFRADIRACFLLAAGYGDLSSERAYLRGETLSCIRDDGGVMETRLDSYAVGEDGKAGLRDRLVTKQG